MDAAVNPADAGFVGGLLKAGERARDTGQADR